jgi:hypothetical protein
VANELWRKYWELAIDPNIFFGMTSSSGASDPATDTRGGLTTGKKGILLSRVRPMDTPLTREIKKIFGINWLNVDYIAQFRAIISFEKESRAKLRELEKDLIE